MVELIQKLDRGALIDSCVYELFIIDPLVRLLQFKWARFCFLPQTKCHSSTDSPLFTPYVFIEKQTILYFFLQIHLSFRQCIPTGIWTTSAVVFNSVIFSHRLVFKCLIHQSQRNPSSSLLNSVFKSEHYSINIHAYASVLFDTFNLIFNYYLLNLDWMSPMYWVKTSYRYDSVPWQIENPGYDQSLWEN